MKLCFLANAKSSHIEKWSRWFVEKGHEVHIVSFNNASIPGTNIHYINTGTTVKAKDIKKLNYLFHGVEIRKIIRAINPDIINAHFATSYGTAIALAGIKKPYFLSVWGSDIYDFPKKSLLHKWMLKFSLGKATYLLSTSKAMADEASKYTNRKFEITPFGVDCDLFTPDKRKRHENFIIGTVKTLEPKYGIDYLLKAVSRITRSNPEIPLRVRIAGSGANEGEYHELAQSLGIDNIVTWLGYISQQEAALEWANMDLAIVYSTLESFGVSAVEANACGTPVIISDIPGLMEATKPGVTSVVVPREKEELLAQKIVELYYNPQLRFDYGMAGRRFVKEQYELNKCFEKIENLFKNACSNETDKRQDYQP